MSQEPHDRRVGDTRKPLSVTMKQKNAAGVSTVVDLTGLATPQFMMVNAADGTTKIAATTTGVTVESAAAGTVSYLFSAGGVDEAGVFWGTFIVTESSRTDHIPRAYDGLKIVFDSDTQSGKDAYRAALES